MITAAPTSSRGVHMRSRTSIDQPVTHETGNSPCPTSTLSKNDRGRPAIPGSGNSARGPGAHEILACGTIPLDIGEVLQGDPVERKQPLRPDINGSMEHVLVAIHYLGCDGLQDFTIWPLREREWDRGHLRAQLADG